jgi:hypothetical protein
MLWSMLERKTYAYQVGISARADALARRDLHFSASINGCFAAFTSMYILRWWKIRSFLKQTQAHSSVTSIRHPPPISGAETWKDG